MLVDSEDFKKFGEQIKNFSQHNYEKGILPDLSNINMGALQKQQKNSYLADIKRLISNCKISGNFDQCESQLEEYTKKYIDKKFPVSLDTMFNILHSYLSDGRNYEYYRYSITIILIVCRVNQTGLFLYSRNIY